MRTTCCGGYPFARKLYRHHWGQAEGRAWNGYIADADSRVDLSPSLGRHPVLNGTRVADLAAQLSVCGTRGDQVNLKPERACSGGSEWMRAWQEQRQTPE